MELYHFTLMHLFESTSYNCESNGAITYHVCLVAIIYHVCCVALDFHSLVSCLTTVNVDIFAQLNFRAASIKRHILVVTFSRTKPVNSSCSILMIIFTQIKLSRI